MLNNNIEQDTILLRSFIEGSLYEYIEYFANEFIESDDIEYKSIISFPLPDSLEHIHTISNIIIVKEMIVNDVKISIKYNPELFNHSVRCHVNIIKI